MSKTYSAGIVTAYGAAKRAGYQGTYEDFCRQQAGYAESAATVEQAKNTAVSAASTATAKAGEAATAATAAQTAKTQTEATASQALTDISIARSGAISAVQTEGQTQTANARAQAQAAAQSATTASTKASEASASATSAGLSATNAAASATSADQSARDAHDVLDSIPADYLALSANVSQLKADLSEVENTLESLFDITYTEYLYCVTYNANYWRAAVSPKLQSGTQYRMVVTATSTFHLDVLQMGSSGNSASMVDTIASNIDFVVGENVFLYTPSVTGLLFVRVLDNANNISSIKFYTIVKTSKADVALSEISDINNSIDDLESDVEELQALQTGITKEEVYGNAVRLNHAVAVIRNVKNQTDESIESLLPLKVSENNSEYSCTIPSIGSHSRAIIRVGLHNGVKTVQNTSYYDYDEMYLEGNSNTDFSDVRFFDANGKILKAAFGPLVNMELCADKRLDKVLQVLSDGSLIAYDDTTGMSISTDGGATFTVISGTYNVTQHGSDVYNRKSMYPVFADSNDNIYAYAGGLLYKLLASDNYATKTQVCDFSWSNNETTIYPDIQNHGMDMDTNGNLIFGTYARTRYYHSDIFASTNGGSSFTLVWHNYNGEYQHIHHVHADKYSSKVYVGIDDDGSHQSGSKIIVTDDGGTTWDDITDDFNVRGKDYYPTYFGNGFKLGSGEVFIMGSGSLYRSENDSNLDVVINGVSSIRSFANYGNDDLIICGSQSSTYVSENQIFISTDKGKTWESIYKKDQVPYETSGIGYRDIKNAVTLPGETDSCIIMPRGTGYVPSFKVYKGGNYWYREAFIEVENTDNNDIVITAKCGYAVKYPYSTLAQSDTIKPVYSVPFNERIGDIISDCQGNAFSISGKYAWDTKCESVHYGDYSAPTKFDFMPSSGLKLKKPASVNFGKIKQLGFNDDFSISFWMNYKSIGLTQSGWESIPRAKRMFTFGNIFIEVNQNRWWMCSDSTDNHTGVRCYENPWYFSNEYFHVVLTYKNGAMKVFINGSEKTSRSDLGTVSISSNLSERDFVVQTSNTDNPYLADIRIYDKELSSDEVLAIYRGW